MQKNVTYKITLVPTHSLLTNPKKPRDDGVMSKAVSQVQETKPNF